MQELREIINRIDQELVKSGLLEFPGNTSLVRHKFNRQFTKSLQPHNRYNLKFNCHWHDLQNFGADQEYLIIDLGGTFLKFFQVSIKNNRLHVVKETKSDFFKPIIYTPSTLFEGIIKLLKNFLGEQKISEVKKIIFVFSFPLKPLLRENGQYDGVCTFFSKAHQSKNIVGCKIGSQFEKHLLQAGFINAQVNLTNDSTPGLFAAKALEIQEKTSFDTAINLIVGTGTNLAIAHHSHGKLTVANTELGQYRFWPLSKIDRLAQQKMALPGHYQTEKLYAGKWRQDVLKATLNYLISRKTINPAEFQIYLKQEFSSAYFDNLTSQKNLNPQLTVIKHLWQIISERGGKICATVLSLAINQLADKSEQKKLNAGIILTGGVLDHDPVFRRSLVDQLPLQLQTILSRKHLPHTYMYSLSSLEQQTIFGSIIFDLFCQKSHDKK